MLRIVYESNKDVHFFVISNSDPVMVWQATYFFFLLGITLWKTCSAYLT